LPLAAIFVVVVVVVVGLHAFHKCVVFLEQGVQQMLVVGAAIGCAGGADDGTGCGGCVCASVASESPLV
jgi:hypothetical protein